MKNLLKLVGAAALVLSPVIANAQVVLPVGYDDSAAGLTGAVQVTGDGGAGGGGLGWLNVNNTGYNEITFDFDGAGEVYYSLQQNRAMATVGAVHLGGKGAVYYVSTSGLNQQCVEDIAAAAAGNAATTALDGVFDSAAIVFRLPHLQPADFTPADNDANYVLAATCTPSI